MDVKVIKKQLREKYPGKTIVEGKGEIVCEIQPSSENPVESIAIAVIDKTLPHHHKVTTEKYEVITGKLSLFCDNKEYVLNEGETLTIKPKQTHHAEGNATWIKCTSNPGWTPEDHLLKSDS